MNVIGGLFANVSMTTAETTPMTVPINSAQNNCLFVFHVSFQIWRASWKIFIIDLGQ